MRFSLTRATAPRLDLGIRTHCRSESRLSELQARYDVLTSGGKTAQPEVTGDEAGGIIAALDDCGWWVSTYTGERFVGQPKIRLGERYLSSEFFSRNLTALCEFVRTKSRPDHGD
jgi:hypothetical protein